MWNYMDCPITLERARTENLTHENKNQYWKSDHSQRNRSSTSSPPLSANSEGDLRINQNPHTYFILKKLSGVIYCCFPFADSPDAKPSVTTAMSQQKRIRSPNIICRAKTEPP